MSFRGFSEGSAAGSPARVWGFWECSIIKQFDFFCFFVLWFERYDCSKFQFNWIYRFRFMQVFVQSYAQFLDLFCATVFDCLSCLTEFFLGFESEFWWSLRSEVYKGCVKILEQSEIV